MKKIDSIGIVLRPSSPNIKELFIKIKDLFEYRGIDVYIDAISANMIGVYGNDFDDMCKNVDFLISIGGDGTLISTARRAFAYNKPVLGVNIGKLGFLTDINPSEVENFIDDMLQKQYAIDNRIVLEAQLINSLGIKKLIGLNDFVITRKNISHTIRLRAKIDSKIINNYRGDGLIISTPTGSTAYNLSSGGPLLYPMTHAYVVNPICPHSFTQRPIVLPSHFELEIDTLDDEGGIVIVDGQEIYDLNKNDTIKIKIASEYIKLIHKKDRDYFDVLRDKLNWGDE